MKVFILTLGTRGDLELFLSLGLELHRRGHAVALGTSAFYRQTVEAAGLAAVPVGAGQRQQLCALLAALAAVRDRTERTRQYFRRWLRPQLATGAAAIAS